MSPACLRTQAYQPKTGRNLMLPIDSLSRSPNDAFVQTQSTNAIVQPHIHAAGWGGATCKFNRVMSDSNVPLACIPPFDRLAFQSPFCEMGRGGRRAQKLPSQALWATSTEGVAVQPAIQVDDLCLKPNAEQLQAAAK